MVSIGSRGAYARLNNVRWGQAKPYLLLLLQLDKMVEAGVNITTDTDSLTIDGDGRRQ